MSAANVPIRPLADYVAAVAEKAESKTASGLYLPDKAQEKPKTFKVVAVGSKVEGIGLGERILCKSYETTEVKVDGVDYILVKEENILATVQ